jgi:TPP-dependent 2-oxoacid decarboxylase
MKTTVGKYLLDSLKNLGIRDIFGVPGDYNLLFLDDVMADKKLRWVGDTNELNAGYAADAYSRIHGISALLTTGGVGELSAVNALGAAFAENVPIIHIVGHPSLQALQDKKFIHHFLEEGERFTTPHKEIASKVSEGYGVVTRYNATLEIPRLLQMALESKKPVTLYLPSNENNQPIEASPHKADYPASSKSQLQALLGHIQSALKVAKNPLLIIDVLASRFSLKKEIRHLVRHLNIPAVTTLFGRGVLDETAPQFIGLYMGDLSAEVVKQAVEKADTILIIGGLHNCDYNTGKFTLNFNKVKHLIQLKGNHAIVNGAYMQGVWLPHVIESMKQKLSPVNKKGTKFPLKKESKSIAQKPGILTQASFWQEVAPLLSQQDVIGVFEVGTAIWASTMLATSMNTEFIGSYGYASIGYATPAVLGTSLADPSRRTIAFIGDGSFQVSAQAVSSLLKHRQKPVIFLLNNDGYTIERVIHGPKEAYNDIQMWDYQAFVKSLTLDKKQIYTAKVATLEQLRKELKTLPSNQLVFIEVILDRMDAPQALKTMFENPPKVSLYI